MEPKHTFSKRERLYLREELKLLFTQAQIAFIAYPFRVVVYRASGGQDSHGGRVSVVISVAKKRFKRAVQRNLLKRRTREAYRRSKDALSGAVAERGDVLFIAFQFIGDAMPQYAQVRTAVERALAKISRKCYAAGEQSFRG